MNLKAIILAAGKGTRMNSMLPKVLHKVCGAPLIHYAVQAVEDLHVDKTVVVVGHGADQVKDFLENRVVFAEQIEQLGTGHAVLSARDVIAAEDGLILVTSGDMPLLTSQTLQNLIDLQVENSGPVSMLTVITEDPRGFGRVVRGYNNWVQAIVEEAQASPEILAIRELNVGAYCFNAAWLWQALQNIPLSPKGEYYLTDVIALAVAEGKRVATLVVPNEHETMGINTRIHLAEAEAVMQHRILNQLMLEGVTIINPACTYIESSVTIGQDCVIQPNTFIRGKTVIGQCCEIGPNSIIRDCQIGNHCTLLSVVMEKAIVEDHVDMGPFARLRKGAHLGPGVHMGNFGEVKDSYLGAGTKMGHFSYIGNATIGTDVNIGAGTITCNYDGEHKHPTVIGDRVFIGSDTMLVAPLNIGDDARTGAGAVVTHDVPAGTVVYGVPAKPHRKKDEVE
jgi:bifunctional UDP-N-acetylglucosamine pyrophosphorylase/glucosamine-1-phosphate N-acetyltransferase